MIEIILSPSFQTCFSKFNKIQTHSKRIIESASDELINVQKQKLIKTRLIFKYVLLLNDTSVFSDLDNSNWRPHPNTSEPVHDRYTYKSPIFTNKHSNVPEKMYLWENSKLPWMQWLKRLIIADKFNEKYI